MAFQHRTNSGSLFKNTMKQEGERTPDYRGELDVDGRLYEVAGWIKDGAKGKFMSLAVKPKDGAGTSKREKVEDECPF
jgi:hypothetical protein